MMSSDVESHNLNDTELEILEVIRQHFEPSYYLLSNPDVERAGIDPLLHYTLQGWREGRDPNPKFSTHLYLLDNPDVAQSGVHPFWHYIVAGVHEGRLARRSQQSNQFDNDEVRQRMETIAALRAIKPHFDATYYLQTNPDVAKAGIDPLFHYFKYGWKENRNPTLDFSTLGYLTLNPDVAAAEINPFLHYHTAGKAEGRVWQTPEAPAARVSETTIPNISSDRIEKEVAAIRDTFDAGFYLRQNPDVERAGVDPIEHFIIWGWKEGRDPNQYFSVAYYLEANPDIRELELNPFWHYTVAGKAEGRLARHPGGYRAETLIHTLPLEETVKAWRSRTPPESVLSATELCALMHDAAAGSANRLMVSIGHDNYRQVSGGVQYCIQHEEETARRRGLLYLNLHPYQPLPRLAHEAESPDVFVSLILAGELIGTAPMSAIIDSISKMAGDFTDIQVVVHHLMGQCPEQVAKLVRATGTDHCWMWLHDFFTLCPSYALQRNNVTFCAAPPVNSNACRLCLYGEERITHRARMAAFFDELSVHVIAPSQFTADYWAQRSSLAAASLTVCEHMMIEWSDLKIRSQINDGPITVAFVGYPAPHKGWPVFERIVRDYRSSRSKFRFLYFGTSHIPLDNVERIPVQVTAEDPEAMIRALSKQSVDIVLHWANCAETFSFSTHEALAAGAFVLTNPISGNVVATVRRLGLGEVLQDETDLVSFFRDGRAENLAVAAREHRRTRKAMLIRSDLTFTVIDRERQH